MEFCLLHIKLWIFSGDMIVSTVSVEEKYAKCVEVSFSLLSSRKKSPLLLLLEL